VRQRLLLATTNRHKAREIAAILSPLGIDVEVPAALPPVVEDGATFLENATKKAVSAAAAAGRVAIADDSGLVVAALFGAPGVHSARYAGPAATDEQNVERLLKECAARGLVDPKAAFVCAAVCCDAKGAVLASAEGRVEGVVRGPPRGRFGFGYDPVFHHVGPLHPPPGVRFADLDPSAKDAISHRGIAFRALAALLLDDEGG
jgi:XTP/dITP diphosphohydrolase